MDLLKHKQRWIWLGFIAVGCALLWVVSWSLRRAGAEAVRRELRALDHGGDGWTTNRTTR